MQKMDVQIVASEHARENMVDGNLPGLPNMVFDHHAHVYLGGKTAELYYFGRSHTNGDIVVLFPERARPCRRRHVHIRTGRPGTDRLLRRRQWQGMDQHARCALMLPFDTVVPGHGPVTTRADMAKFRASTVTLRNRVHEMVGQKKTRDEVAADAEERIPLRATPSGPQPRRSDGRNALSTCIPGPCYNCVGWYFLPREYAAASLPVVSAVPCSPVSSLRSNSE